MKTSQGRPSHAWGNEAEIFIIGGKKTFLGEIFIT